MSMRRLDDNFVVIHAHNESKEITTDIAIDLDYELPEWEGSQTFKAFLISEDGNVDCKPVSELTIIGHNLVVEGFYTSEKHQQKGIMTAIYKWLNNQSTKPFFNWGLDHNGTTNLSEEGIKAANSLVAKKHARWLDDEEIYPGGDC